MAEKVPTIVDNTYASSYCTVNLQVQHKSKICNMHLTIYPDWNITSRASPDW